VDERTGPEAETGEPAGPEPIAGEDTGAEETSSEQPGPEVAGPEESGPERTRFDRMRTSAAGVMMTGIAIGLQEALELPRQHPAFVIQASGEPDGPQGPIDLHFDPDDPTKTVAVIRPATTEGDAPSP